MLALKMLVLVLSVLTLAAHGQSLSAASLSDLETNSAFLFIKPSAVNPEVIKFVKAELKSAGIKVKKQGTISAEEMTKLETIDHHYHEIAMRAIRMFPAELSVTEDGKAKFKEAFGEEWEVAIRSGRVLNVKGALEKMDAATLTNRWNSNEKHRIKMLSGTYVEKIEEDDIYIVNGFYAGMRADYLKAGNTVHWMVVDWKRAKLSWKDFRNKVLGGTDPAKAAAGSLRAEILNRWQPLGLKAAPSMQHNSIHASAGPVEALRERFIWGVVKFPHEDVLYKALLSHGIDSRMITRWIHNPEVHYGDITQHVFDLTENKDTIDVFHVAQAITNRLRDARAARISPPRVDVTSNNDHSRTRDDREL